MCKNRRKDSVNSPNIKTYQTDEGSPQFNNLQLQSLFYYWQKFVLRREKI